MPLRRRCQEDATLHVKNMSYLTNNIEFTNEETFRSEFQHLATPTKYIKDYNWYDASGNKHNKFIIVNYNDVVDHGDPLIRAVPMNLLTFILKVQKCIDWAAIHFLGNTRHYVLREFHNNILQLFFRALIRGSFDATFSGHLCLQFVIEALSHAFGLKAGVNLSLRNAMRSRLMETLDLVDGHGTCFFATFRAICAVYKCRVKMWINGRNETRRLAAIQPKIPRRSRRLSLPNKPINIDDDMLKGKTYDDK